MMLKDKGIRLFFESEAFSKMLLKVGHDDVISYKNNNKWLYGHPFKAIIFSQPEETWNNIKMNYRTTFKDLLIGELPDEVDLITTLKRVAEQLKNIEWNLRN